MLNFLKRLFKQPNQDGLKLQAAYSHFFIARKQYHNLKNLSVGTLETIKRMPDYDEALEKLKEESEKQKKQKDETTRD